ncbi:MAG: hypothetical protein KJ600_06105 [Nanoarchaeota archaeon]|nr:hypothetical protein [Nanoarchaeota archaeon]MBU1104100.1 hypothetical protein [Nanoarchaeota archaeon]
MVWKDWPNYLKTLAIISIVGVVLSILFTIIVSVTLDGDPLGVALIIFLIPVPVFLLIVIPWVFGLVASYLIKKQKRPLANIVLGIGFLGSLFWLLASIIDFSNSQGFFNLVSLYINGMILLGVVILTALLIKMNQKTRTST